MSTTGKDRGNSIRRGRGFSSAGILVLALLALLLLPAEASAARISQSSRTIQKGQSFSLQVKGTSKRVKWSSSKRSVATVSSGGVVKGKAAGKAVITAKAGKKKFICKVTVRQSVKKVKKLWLDAGSLTMHRGETAMLSATVKPDGASQKLSWESSNSKVVSVTKKGKLKAKKTGSAVITVRARDGSGATAKCRIKVEKERTPLVLSAASLELRQGAAAKLGASVDASLLAWGSSNGAVAAVGADGTVTGVAPGAAQIVAMTKDGGQAACCDVTVIPTEGLPSARAQQFLSILNRYSQETQARRAVGHYLGYSNSSKLTRNTWAEVLSDMDSRGIGYTNCAHTARLALREMGLLGTTQNFWGNGDEIKYGAGVKETLEQSCQIMQVNKSVEQLFAEGGLLPGDICVWHGKVHTNVYAGKDPLGQALWYDTGRGTDGGTGLGGGYMTPAQVVDRGGVAKAVMDEDIQNDNNNPDLNSKVYVFNSLGPHGINLGATYITWIIRLK